MFSVNQLEGTAYGLLAASMLGSLLYDYLGNLESLQIVLTIAILIINITALGLLLHFLKSPLHRKLQDFFSDKPHLKRYLPNIFAQKLLNQRRMTYEKASCMRKILAAFDVNSENFRDKVRGTCEPYGILGEKVEAHALRVLSKARAHLECYEENEENEENETIENLFGHVVPAQHGLHDELELGCASNTPGNTAMCASPVDFSPVDESLPDPVILEQVIPTTPVDECPLKDL
eukprot:NODE_445_length_1738_cov_35.846063_g371_i0.p1 GENE.NODE_445_length_1738_cov_35.846063_g371_i0~~NODE_445_length_1738_cov_35.846063_g371_i0.p1  ORF type:complete len:233 (-),score=63.20 NODE_445_length_1738_cov_35.846063_g371_i0:107-805(-)